LSKYLQYIIISILGLYATLEISGQAPIDAFDDIKVMDNLDTLVITRTNGSWWYGLQGGANYYQAFGTLYTMPPPSSFNRETGEEIKFSGGNGLGVNVGLVGEWVEPGSLFSATLRLDYDLTRTLSANADNQVDASSSEALENYAHESEFSYFRISPSLRYNFGENGLHGLAGLNIDIPVTQTGLLKSTSENTASIIEGTPFYYNSENSTDEEVLGSYELVKTNYGVHVGAGWDILLGDVFGTGRLRFTPFAIASVNLGAAQGKLAAPFDDVESFMNLANLRVGVQIKFSYDNLSYDTLYYDSTFVPPAAVVVDLLEEQGVNFDGFIKPRTVEPEEISYIELPKIQEQLREDAVINIERPTEQTADIAEVPQKPKEEIKLNVDRSFNYRSTSSTAPSKQMRDYLDAVADYMRENPKVNLNIVVHTDNTGSSADKTKRGQNRIDRVKQYLLKDGGISERRLIDRNLRDTRPAQSNRTEAGRRANRRLIIRVLPGRSARR